MTADVLSRELRAASSGGQCLELLSESRRVLDFGIVGFRDRVDSPVAPRLADAEHWASRFGWPAGFMAGWLAGNHASHFPRSSTPRQADTPSYWYLPDLNDARTVGTLDVRKMAAARYMRGFGISGGVTIPVRRPFGQIGCLTWIMSEGRTVSLDGPRLLTMQHFCRDFFEALDHCGGWRSTAPLSPRALECLQLAACGLSDKQIAHRIARSVDTVRFHMKAAIRQLDAVNRTHAVALAVRAGLIGALGGRP